VSQGPPQTGDAGHAPAQHGAAASPGGPSSDRGASADGDDDQPRGEAQGRDDEQKPKRRNPLKNPKVLIIGGVVVLIVAVLVLLYWLHARQFQSTDDAFVDTHIVRLAPQISGQVARVLVTDNARVEPGQVLVEIDPSTVRAALEQAIAQRDEAAARLAQSEAQLAGSQESYRQSRVQVPGLAAQATAAERNAERLRTLQATTPRAIAAQQVDQAVAEARQAEAQRDAAMRAAAGAQAQARAARTAIQAARASLEAAQASITQNQINLNHARVIAPVEGYVTQKTVAPGNYVQPGDQLMAIVPTALWVTANFKETQLSLMRVGQPVTMSVDACPAQLRGKVISIQRGSGQAFAALPPENATGNFVKVVQRVPVKIAFLDLPKNCPLGPGLSVSPSVRVR
jgi:membrane fusion protein (multidrug efflux system)